MVGRTVRSVDGDPKFARGTIVGIGRRPGRVIVKWPHETAYSDLRDLEVTR